MLASGSSDLSVKIWDLKTNSCYRTLVGHEHTVSAIEFSSHGDFLISVSRDKLMKFWETATGFCKRTFSGHNEWVFDDDVDCLR
jgi:platelet-activating factor acetylhydrolase IB subunit alpha